MESNLVQVKSYGGPHDGISNLKRKKTFKWLSGKEPICQHRRHGFHLWVRKIPWKKKWQPTPVFLPGKFHGQRTLAGYSLQGQRER